MEEIIAKYDENPPKGEFVLILEGADAATLKEEYLNRAIEDYLKRLSISSYLSLAAELPING